MFSLQKLNVLLHIYFNTLFCTKGYSIFDIICIDKRSVCVNLLDGQQQDFKVVLLATQKLISIEK